jgi:hypothetical protein
MTALVHSKTLGTTYTHTILTLEYTGSSQVTLNTAPYPVILIGYIAQN